MKNLLTILAFCAAIDYSNSHEQARHLESLPCTDSKAVVEEAPGVTYFRIIADSGETLLDINSNNTNLSPFDVLLSTEMMYSEYGHQALVNDSRHYITRNQTTAGDVIRLAGKNGIDIFKENAPFEAYDNARLIKSDFRCARIHDFSLVIHPAFDIKKYDGYNMTALLWSSWFGLSEVARNLIERGADVNQGIEITPVMAAILSNKSELVEFLIRKGANVIEHEGIWLSTFHIAAFVGSTDIARILIEHGVNVNGEKNNDRQTPLVLAILYGQCDILELLLKKGATMNTTTYNNITALQLSITDGHFDCGRLLIEAGADVNAKDNEGNTALIFSIINQEDETRIIETIARFLREFNPDVNIRNNNGETALAIANRKNFTKIAELLKSKGAV